MVGINGYLRLMHETTAVAPAFGIFKDLKAPLKDSPNIPLYR
jgi:hypothetical protein